MYADGDTEELLLTPVGHELFLLEESSLLGHGFYHDTISTKTRDDGSLEFVEVVKPSGLSSSTWILSKSLVESETFSSVLADVMRAGGNWERALGGLVVLHLPPEEATSILERVKLLSGAK